jgi:hypothetical protein
VFYVVTGTYSFKLGITSGDPRPRLCKHQLNGYTAVARLFTGLPDGAAKEMEDRLLKDLPTNGFEPVLRKEYFAIEALPLVLRIVDETLGGTQAGGLSRADCSSRSPL